jgi:16S rRNA (cytidine1402-2'-O)-methyltransferase
MKAQEISLSVVATPIGNLDDLSPRARQVLETVDWIAAEDTRHTLNLLRHCKIEKELISLHEHSSTEKISALVERLQKGERGAYVSDAGTPGISDPGSKLVKACWDENLRVSPIPGPSAVATIMSVSGMDETEFSFMGFFPRENREREELATRLQHSPSIYVFYESPHRARQFLEWAEKNFPDAILVMGRELTKKFEEIRRGSAKELLEILEIREEILGEFVFVLQLEKVEKAGTESLQRSPEEIAELLKELHTLGANQKILHAVAKSWGMSRSDSYNLALKILGKKTD